ncbi:Crp/Fnr family transcriptional regulator [Sphingomonas piscis]|uniref:Crp/Fnr family transcriptional regulator n=1 Tax=Sphingomonas piscis TaxID=2714943 RepID=A0A6G7YPW2_9SPHN|nr:Crp/Fnr family transcriptional regulator [Sphingomonas piscis]QIK78780.1 Crp/Fnr family transcriptional regulator [Sphingomonas piscis]
MSEVITDELSQLDGAFAGNRLLSTFPNDARAILEPDCEVVELVQGDIVFTPGESLKHSIFPINQTMICLTVDLDLDRSIEVTSVGREGAVGGIISCGHAPAFTKAAVLIAGPALRIPLQALQEAKSRSSFIGNIFCRYSDYLLSTVMQAVACNAFHPIPARAARWLLTAQDRGGDRIELTQEMFASLLGVQRTTVNAIVRGLQDEGLISNRRGVIQVVDRAGLVRRACSCYQSIETHFSNVIGLTGSGTAAD